MGFFSSGKQRAAAAKKQQRAFKSGKYVSAKDAAAHAEKERRKAGFRAAKARRRPS